MDVRELIANDHRTVVLGEAGGGKTTVLRRLMLDTASLLKTPWLIPTARRFAHFYQVECPRSR